MAMNPTPIRRIYEMPGHCDYGPARRLWIMLEQIFADRGGVARVETRIWEYQDNIGRARIKWDTHLSMLLTSLPEAAAQRTVMHQMLTAAEFVS